MFKFVLPLPDDGDVNACSTPKQWQIPNPSVPEFVSLRRRKSFLISKSSEKCSAIVRGIGTEAGAVEIGGQMARSACGARRCKRYGLDVDINVGVHVAGYEPNHDAVVRTSQTTRRPVDACRRSHRSSYGSSQRSQQGWVPEGGREYHNTGRSSPATRSGARSRRIPESKTP